MKYYKLTNLTGLTNSSYKLGKIYPENYKREKECLSVKEFLGCNNFTEVSESEYLEQEGLWKLPEAWCIKAKNSDEAIIMLPYMEQKYKEFSSEGYNEYDATSYYIHFKGEKCVGCFYDIHFDCTEITFEQFKKYVLKQYNMTKPYVMRDDVTYEMINNHPYFKTLSENKLCDVIGGMDYKGFVKLRGDSSKDKAIILYNKWNSKIIGYRTPIEFNSGEVKIGEIFKEYSGSYRCERKVGPFLPREIVETWEPIYEEEYKIGDYIYVLENGWNDSEHKEFKKYAEKGDVIKISSFGQMTGEEHYKVALSDQGHVVYIEKYSSRFRKATPEEIKNAERNALIKEAEKRYPKGTRFKSAADNKLQLSGGIAISWINSEYSDGIANRVGEGLFYANGKWAEIVLNETILYFGKVEFKIKKNEGIAVTSYGKITKEEIKKALDYIENPPLFCGYPLHIYNNAHHLPLTRLSEIDLSLGFGCQKGTYGELKAIYNAF